MAVLALIDRDPDAEFRLEGARVIASMAQNLFWLREAYVKLKR